MSTITRFRSSPVNEMLSWLESEPILGRNTFGLAPFVHVEDFTEDDTYVVRAEIAGIDPDKDVQITLDDDILTIRGERREEQRDRKHAEFHYGSFSRSVRLPVGAKGDEIAASYRDGVLELRVPLDAQPSEPRTIPIQRAQD